MPKNSAKSRYVQEITPQLVERSRAGESQLSLAVEFDLAQSTVSRALAIARARESEKENA